MSPQESHTLQNFLNQLAQVKGVAKDPEADALITRAVLLQPDAAYLIVQRALLLEQALDTAKAQISTLQNQVQSLQSGRSGGFLDGANAWGNSVPDTPRATMSPAVPATQYSSAVMPATAPIAASRGFLGGGAGNVLGTIAATAAGVAGGAFLFNGIGNLLGHHGGGGFSDQQQQQQQHGLTAPPADNAAATHTDDGTSAADSSLASEAGLDDINLADSGDMAGGDDGAS